MVSLIEMDCRQAGLVHRISVHWISDGCEICGMNSYASCVSWRVIPNQTRGPELSIEASRFSLRVADKQIRSVHHVFNHDTHVEYPSAH